MSYSTISPVHNADDIYIYENRTGYTSEEIAKYYIYKNREESQHTINIYRENTNIINFIIMTISIIFLLAAILKSNIN